MIEGNYNVKNLTTSLENEIELMNMYNVSNNWDLNHEKFKNLPLESQYYLINEMRENLIYDKIDYSSLNMSIQDVSKFQVIN